MVTDLFVKGSRDPFLFFTMLCAQAACKLTFDLWVLKHMQM
jgi:hypothetical protein